MNPNSLLIIQLIVVMHNNEVAERYSGLSARLRALE